MLSDVIMEAVRAVVMAVIVLHLWRRGRQQELLSFTGDTDVRALSHFQAVLTRRLRRFFDDPDKRIHLIGWDFEDETWDQDHKNLIDGTYYVSDRTARALQAHFDVAA